MMAISCMLYIKFNHVKLLSVLNSFCHHNAPLIIPRLKGSISLSLLLILHTWKLTRNALIFFQSFSATFSWSQTLFFIWYQFKWINGNDLMVIWPNMDLSVLHSNGHFTKYGHQRSQLHVLLWKKYFRLLLDTLNLF
jgi:hypothetical protein